MVLKGTEVKSLRQGRANLKDSYARIKNGEVFVHQMHISPYPFAYYDNHDPLRPRKLLLHNREIKKLARHTQQKGHTLIPLNIHFKRGLAKLELGLCRGKSHRDRRQTIKTREAKIEISRAMRARYH